jgi:hypothetical protein
MKKLARSLAVLVLSPLVAGAGGGQTNANLPVPPMQHAAWTAPGNNLPTNFASATSLLFDQGLADPRYCEYREIEVRVGNVWNGDGGVITTHGWVLPSTNSAAFAICWNGLVYPLVSAGANADLTLDMIGLVTNGVATWQNAIPEAVSVSTSSLLGIKGCLLWRLGQRDLATVCWQIQTARTRDRNAGMMPAADGSRAPGTNWMVPLPEADPYLAWTTEWTWAMFDRLICAHERGDETLALATARQLAEAQPKIEAECAKRGFRRPPSFMQPSSPGKEMPFLGFLGQLPQILVDLERREKEGEHESVVKTGLSRITNQTERIAALIRDLDLVEARQWGQPGGVDLAQDPVVSALTREGDPAIEPLLDCLENDKRLTRSVGFGRDFHQGRTVIPVASAVMVALQDILHAGFGGGEAEIRAYWNQNKGLKLEDRWYSMLKDDSGIGRWLEAAGNIAQPENVTTSAGGWTVTRQVPANTPIPMRGEVLRSKINPSVTELMTRRALEVPGDNPNSYDLEAACKMALNLAAWDPQAADPVAKTLVKRACTAMNYAGKQMGTYVAKLSVACAKAGDFAPFRDYAAWVKTTTPEQLDFSRMDCLKPLLEFPTNEILQSAAEALFGDTNSPWGKLPWKGAFGENPVRSDLVQIPAFRMLLTRELEKTNVCGSFTWRASGELDCMFTNGESGAGYGAMSLEGGPPADGATSDLRWCDWIELSLSLAKEPPFFNPFTSMKKRDEAIGKTKACLLQQ